jgi:hypothetical protein
VSVENFQTQYWQHSNSLTTHCHLWADCLENVGASTFHNSMDVHHLLQG